MKCYKCGSEIPSNSLFCNMCGARMGAEKEQEEFEEYLDETTESTDFDAESTEEVIESVSDDIEDAQEPVILNGGISNIRFCRFCGRQMSQDDLYCPSCGNNDNGKKKKSSYKALIFGIIAAALILVIISGAGFLMKSGRIQGEWICKGNDIFSMFETTYLEFDDDGTAEYYDGMFSHQEWKYTYNPFDETLTVSDIRGGQKETLHIEWLNKNSFILLETGMTFVRTEEIPEGYDEDVYGEYEEF